MGRRPARHPLRPGRSAAVVGFVAMSTEREGADRTELEPKPEHHFTFGLWTVGNPGRDPFGHEVRPPLDPVDVGAPPGRARRLRRQLPRRRPRAVRLVGRASARRSSSASAQALDETGMKVPMATTNLFSPAGVQGGRVHRQRPAGPPLRRGARRSTPSTSAPSSAPTVFVMWGGREGVRGRRGQGRARRARPLRRGRRTSAARTSASAATTLRDRARAEAERAARRHVPADRRARAGLHRASSSGPTWSGSTPSSPTRRCRA